MFPLKPILTVFHTKHTNAIFFRLPHFSVRLLYFDFHVNFLFIFVLFCSIFVVRFRKICTRKIFHSLLLFISLVSLTSSPFCSSTFELFKCFYSVLLCTEHIQFSKQKRFQFFARSLALVFFFLLMCFVYFLVCVFLTENFFFPSLDPLFFFFFKYSYLSWAISAKTVYVHQRVVTVFSLLVDYWLWQRIRAIHKNQHFPDKFSTKLNSYCQQRNDFHRARRTMWSLFSVFRFLLYFCILFAAFVLFASFGYCWCCCCRCCCCRCCCCGITLSARRTIHTKLADITLFRSYSLSLRSRSLRSIGESGS